MKEITVNKADLRAKVEANRAEHRAVFDEAVVTYQKRLEELLERKLDAVRKGHKVQHYISLVVPEEHTKDYDRVLEMLDMAIGDEIVISQQEFAMYVMDDWAWRESFTSNTGSYTAAYAVDEGI